MAGDGGYRGFGLVSCVESTQTPQDRLLAVSTEQYALDGVGLAHPGIRTDRLATLPRVYECTW
jgi:hypothetical protein